MGNAKKNYAPVGVFDSGVGGLTVAREIMRQLPEENVVYFGDTARVPYGSKSKNNIIRFSRQIIRFLQTKEVKAIVIACNTASALALETVQKEVDIPVIGVIEPGARAAVRETKNGCIGVAGTEATIRSQTYTRVIQRLRPDARVIGKACPLFVPLVEEGFAKHPITEEVIGTQIDTEAFNKAVTEAINGFQSTLDLTEAGCYILPRFTSESEEVKAATDAMNSYLGATVTYDFNPYTEVVDASVISQWVTVDADMNVTFNQDAVKAYIQSLADKYNTKGKTRTITTATGNTVTVEGGSYGWKIDQEAEYNALTANIQNAEVVTREPAYTSRAASHEGNDFGSTFAEVDLTNQMVYFVQNGQVALSSPCVTGNPNNGHGTPQGVYSLAYKELDSVLRGEKLPDGSYEYESPVKYWMPFNGGIGFHDATWQPTFGGSRYLTGGSHGCVNMPYDAAGQLYNLISAGTPVVCHY